MLNQPAISADNLVHVQNFHTIRHRWVTALSWSAAYDILAVANAFDASLYRFAGDRIAHQRITGHTEPVRAAVISANGDWLVTGGDDSRVGVWNIAPQQANYTYLIDAPGPVINVAACPTAERIAYVVGTDVWQADYDGGNRQLWHASERDLTATLYSNDGDWLLATGWDGTIRARHLADGEVRQLDEQAERINALAFHPDGTILAAVSRAGRLTTYDWPSGRILNTVAVAHDTKAVDSVAFSPDGTLLATGGRDARCRLWQPDTLDPLGALEAHRKPVLALGFSRDGRVIATGSGDNTVRLWGQQG